MVAAIVCVVVFIPLAGFTFLLAEAERPDRPHRRDR